MNFSVLMSVYHKENAGFFDQAIESILVGQELKPTEFVLVCDGPLTSELDTVIHKYLDEFPEILRVYRLEKNVGLGNALNFGLEKCKFEYVARADSDDVCCADRFRVQLEYLERHPQISVVGSDIQEFDNDPNTPSSLKKMPEMTEDIVRMARFRNPMNHMTVVFKKSDVLQVGSYMDLSYLEDYYLWVRMLVAGYEMHNISKPLVNVRIGSGMVERRSNRAYIGGWRILNRYLLSERFINRFHYCRNMFSVRFFIYCPKWLKKIMYKVLLRK